MAKIAAIDFDDNSARVIVAKTTGNSFQIQSAFEIGMKSSFENDAAEFGKDLAEALGSRVGRCDALVSFGRGMSELRLISVPVVPDNELPEIVRFQAMRQFANCAEDAPVDFLTLSKGTDEKKILAATVPADILEKLKSGCSSAGLQLKAAKLRSTCSTALCQHATPELKNCIVFDASEKSFNLEVVAFGKLCLTRTVRTGSKATPTQVVNEIRRTLAAANNQIPEYETSKIVIFGLESEFDDIRAAIEADLQFDVTFINPFDHATGLTDAPERVGTYASLVGLLLDHTSKKTDTIDFLNPRKKVKSKTGSRSKMLIAVAAALLIVGLFGLGYLMLSKETQKIAKIKSEISALTANHKVATEKIGDIGRIEKFDNTQAIWLRELANLSEDYSEPDHAILNSATFSLKPTDETEGTRITLSGYTNGIEAPEAIRAAVRDSESGHEITDIESVLLTSKEKTQEHYDRKFKATIFRSPELKAPEVPDEMMTAYMNKRKTKSPDGQSKDVETENKNDNDDESKELGPSESSDEKTVGDDEVARNAQEVKK